MKRLLVVLPLALALAATACSRGNPAPAGSSLHVLAAASLVDLFERLGPLAAPHCGARPIFGFGASANIRAQIERGVPVDVFVSASSLDMNRLERAGLLRPGTRRDLYANELLLVTPLANPGGIHALEDLRTRPPQRIALGDPDTVPAGYYAREALQKAHLWDALSAHLIFGEDVRVVLGWIARNEVDAGFVYRSDARSRDRILRVVQAVAAPLHAPIRYPAAVLRDAPHPAAGAAFINWLASPAAIKQARAFGFEQAAETGR